MCVFNINYFMLRMESPQISTSGSVHGPNEISVGHIVFVILGQYS